MPNSKMVSYSHNFEDVMIRRAFGDVPTGTYVDVGAGWPTKTSNTYDLYKKGWRGLIVEPQIGLFSDYKRAWDEARPDDMLIAGAVGATPGALDFYICNQRNMSTGAEDTVAYWQRQGANFGEATRVPVHMLRTLLADHGIEEFQLLCIDVEGMEWHALTGLDLERFRPWLMVIEATKPGSYEPNCERWEPMVMRAGYALVYEDGSNRWYVAYEREADLRAKFRYPPCVWDNFVGWREAELEAKVKELEMEQRKGIVWGSNADSD